MSWLVNAKDPANPDLMVFISVLIPQASSDFHQYVMMPPQK